MLQIKMFKSCFRLCWLCFLRSLLTRGNLGTKHSKIKIVQKKISPNANVEWQCSPQKRVHSTVPTSWETTTHEDSWERISNAQLSVLPSPLLFYAAVYIMLVFCRRLFLSCSPRLLFRDNGNWFWTFGFPLHA